MIRLVKTLCCLLLGSALTAQPSLKVEKGVVFQLTGDTFLLDSLVMRDSSILLLDMRHNSCLIRTNYFSAGNGVLIVGVGHDGKRGSDGTGGIDLAGRDGTYGSPGINLTLNFSNLSLQGQLEIDLYGGG